MKILLNLTTFSLILFLISGCVAGPNELVNTPDEEGQIAGFWQGLWQGFISPFTFIISLFSDTVHVYEVHNNGGWYNFGFLLGASIIFGGSGGGAARRRR
ncbi:MAG: hypothetical protein P8074_24795 [Anaerolineales bacterium]|jgi:hypothetical protein